MSQSHFCDKIFLTKQQHILITNPFDYFFKAHNNRQNLKKFAVHKFPCSEVAHNLLVSCSRPELGLCAFNNLISHTGMIRSSMGSEPTFLLERFPTDINHIETLL